MQWEEMSLIAPCPGLFLYSPFCASLSRGYRLLCHATPTVVSNTSENTSPNTLFLFSSCSLRLFFFCHTYIEETQRILKFEILVVSDPDCRNTSMVELLLLRETAVGEI